MSAPARDVVVVGAGPAGAAVAARLAGLGHAVLLLDREEFPRAKPCGECLSPAAVRALEELGALERVRGAEAAAIRGWRIHPALGAPFAGDFPAGAAGLAVSRTVLDALLLEHARARGAEVRTRVRVADVVVEAGRVVGVRAGPPGREEVIRARLVIGADGLRSVVVRRLGLIRRPPRLRKLALTAHVRGVEGLEGRGELHVERGRCVGIADVGAGEANVTVVLSGARAAAVAGARDGYFDALLREAPRLAGAERCGAVLATGPFDWPVRRAVADGALLVGDAAGYYDPFTGQGIYRALRGAELAAGAAHAALRAGDASAAALLPYERGRRRAFAPGERLQRLIEEFVARPRLLAVVAGRFRRRPELAEALIAATGDVRPVRSLLSPALLVKLVA